MFKYEFRLALVLVVIQLTGASAKTYSLDALLEMGFENSEEIRIVEQEMKKAESLEKEYYGKALPTIAFNSNYQYAHKSFNPLATGEGMGDEFSIAEYLQSQGISVSAEPGSYIIAGMLDGMLGSLTPKKNQASAGISLQQPIFAQGKVLTGLKIAKLYNRSLLCKWQDTKMGVKAKITKLFYATLLAQRNEEAQKNAVSLATEAHRIAVLRLQAGNGTELDTLNSRLHLENSLNSYQEAQKSRRMALDALVKSAGIAEKLDAVQLDGDFPDEEYAVELDSAITRVQSENKKVVQLNVAREIQRHLVTLVKSDYLPIVYCGGSISKITQFNFDDKVYWQDDQRLYIGLTYTLFSGMQRLQKIRQAKSDVYSIDQTRQLAIEGLELATRNAWEDLETSRRRLRQAESLCALAQKAYTVSKKAYELGSIKLIDLQDSEQKFNGAHIALNAAQFTFHSAVVDMRVLLGDYIYE